MRKKMKKCKCSLSKVTIISLLLTLFFMSGQGLAKEAKESCLKFTGEHGPYAVGFKAVNLYDYSRTFHADFDNQGKRVTEKARPIQTSIWYPADAAKAKTATHMQYKDYIYLVSHEQGFHPLTEDLKKRALESFHSFLSTSKEKKAEQEFFTGAIKNAEAAEGSFPLIVYGPSFHSFSFENSQLCEFLASHGYIVVASPCAGKVTRSMTQDFNGTDTQARDMQFLLGYMQNFPHLDKTKTAVMGFSWGGMSSVLTALRDTRINAVICIDGSVRSPQGLKMVTESLSWKLETLKMPMLFFISKEFPESLLKKWGLPKREYEFKFYDMLKYSTASVFQFHQLTHRNFSSEFVRFMTRRPDRGESSLEEINQGYSTMSRYVLNFLNGYIKGDKEALGFIQNSPKKNGIAETQVTQRSSKIGKKAPPMINTFIHMALEKGVEKIQQMYEDLQQKYPDYKLNEERLAGTGWELVINKRYDPALAIFKLAVQINPKYAMGYWGIGESYEFTGKYKEAIKAYQKVMELAPMYDELKDKVKKLKGKLL
jgi:tetratricopeptide (TPR) repeat protein